MSWGQTHAGDGNIGRVRQHELDMVEPRAHAPVLDGRGPSVASVAEAVEEDDCGRVLRDGLEEERLHLADWHLGCGCGGSGFDESQKKAEQSDSRSQVE